MRVEWRKKKRAARLASINQSGTPDNRGRSRELCETQHSPARQARQDSGEATEAGLRGYMCVWCIDAHLPSRGLTWFPRLKSVIRSPRQ